jgi:hypothetical protein
MYNYDSILVGALADQRIQELHREADRRRLARLARAGQLTDAPSERISRSWWRLRARPVSEEAGA